MISCIAIIVSQRRQKRFEEHLELVSCRPAVLTHLYHDTTHYTINGLSPYVPTHVDLSRQLQAVLRGHLVRKVLTEGDSSDLVPAVAVQDSQREEELMDDEM